MVVVVYYKVVRIGGRAGSGRGEGELIPSKGEVGPRLISKERKSLILNGFF